MKARPTSQHNPLRSICVPRRLLRVALTTAIGIGIIAPYSNVNRLVGQDNRVNPSNVPAPSLKTTSGDRVLDSYESRNKSIKDEGEKLNEQLNSMRETETELQTAILKKKSERETRLACKRTMDEWRHATFMVASDRTAIGVQVFGDQNFRLHASASMNQCELVKSIARRYSIPLVQHNEPQFETTCSALKRGEPFPAQAVKQLKEYWKVRTYIPLRPNENAPMVVFRDQEIAQHRVGYLLGVRNGAMEFVSVRGNRETIQRERIESGSARMGIRDELLVEPEVDLYDVAVLEIAKSLGSENNVPCFQSVSIEVDVDELEEALKLSKRIDNTSNDRLLDLISRLNKEEYVPDQRKEGTRILRRYQDVLHDELSQRLVTIGVPVGNREDRQKMVDEREVAQGSHFDQRRYHAMTSATHLVTAAVGKPERGGRFRISIRLTELNTGRALLEFNSDVGRQVQGYAKNCYVQSGSLGILADSAYEAPRKADFQPRPVRLEPIDDQPFEPRIGTFAKVGSERRFYDLFGNASQGVSSDRFICKPIQDVDKLPSHQKLRWLTSELAQASLAIAGRVRSIDGDRVELNIGTNQGVSPGATFRVMRLDSSSYQTTQRILPFELRADSVANNSTSAVIQKDGLTDLWNDITIQLDDVVLPRGAPDPRVRIQFPQASTTLVPKDVASQWNTAFRNGRQLDRLGTTMSQVSEQLTLKIVQGLQLQGISAISTEPSNPTHEITGLISPLEATPNCTRFSVQYSVKSILEDRVIKVLSPIKILDQEVRNWQP